MVRPKFMIRLAHVHDQQAAGRWLARHRGDLEMNPVPLLIVTVAEDHTTMRDLVARLRADTACYIIDASGFGSKFMVPPDTLVLEGPERLREAVRFIDRAHHAKQRLDILVVDDRPSPALQWAQPMADVIEVN